MALKRIPYTRLEPLLRECLSKSEDQKTLALMHRLRPARDRRYLTPGELEAVCRWKSARAIQRIRANTPWKVRSATLRALATRSERQRLEVLRTLQGVSVPMASAILTLLDPRRYGVIDIRVWQLLYKLGVVEQKPGGTGFNFDNWYRFLMIVRYFSRRLSVTARAIERTLFIVHRKYQKDRLYASGPHPPRGKPRHRAGARSRGEGSRLLALPCLGVWGARRFRVGGRRSARLSDPSRGAGPRRGRAAGAR